MSKRVKIISLRLFHYSFGLVIILSEEEKKHSTGGN